MQIPHIEVAHNRAQAALPLRLTQGYEPGEFDI